MATLARPGQVHLLPIPGDNGVTKDRFCVLLDGYPSIVGAEIVVLIFGCSDTKRTARQGTFVRVEREPAAPFRSLGLANPTTFHLEDIRLYDARSPRLDGRDRKGHCPPRVFVELKALLELRYLHPAPIELLPERAGEDAILAAAKLREGAGKGELPDEPTE